MLLVAATVWSLNSLSNDSHICFSTSLPELVTNFNSVYRLPALFYHNYISSSFPVFQILPIILRFMKELKYFLKRPQSCSANLHESLRHNLPLIPKCPCWTDILSFLGIGILSLELQMHQNTVCHPYGTKIHHPAHFKEIPVFSSSLDQGCWRNFHCW